LYSLHQTRKEFANTSILISGPSTAAPPKPTDQKWLAWLKSIAGNQTIPDIYSWHQIGTWSLQPDATVPYFNTMKAGYKLPERPIDINEYAAKEEQNPANSVYYIAQLERHNLRGLRANWGSGGDLHNFLADLVHKGSDGAYHPNGEWQLYKYYAQMGGDRLVTTASSDSRFDVFATKAGSVVKIIAGTRTILAPYDIKVSGLQSLGLPEKGNVRVNVTRFDWSGDRGRVDAPVELGQSVFSYTGNTASCTFDDDT
jgi:hypothetical protein